MKLVLDRFKENSQHYKVEFFTDTDELIYDFDIMKWNDYNLNHELSYLMTTVDEYILEDKVKQIDYLLTNSIDNKFLLLHLNDDYVKKYFDINQYFKLRIKYSKYLVTLVEFGNRLFE